MPRAPSKSLGAAKLRIPFRGITNRALRNVRRYRRRLEDNFGLRMLCMLASANFLRGSVSRMLDSTQLPYYKNVLHMSGTLYQSLFIVSNIPWSMKSMIGSISDVIPMFGYHKRYYIIFYSLIGTLALILVGVIPFSQSQAEFAAFLFFCANYQLASVDLLCQGKYAELMVRRPATSSDVVTFVWTMSNLGSFFGSMVSGPVSDHHNPRFVFLICVPIAFQVILPALYGFLPEKKVKQKSYLAVEKVRKHPRIFLLGLCMAVAASALALASIFGNQNTQFVTSLSTAFVLVVVAFWSLPPLLSRGATYLLLSSALYISIPGALHYFYTADPVCLPNGPHFDFTYYITYTSMAGSLAGAVGVATFQTFLSRRSFRTAFLTGCAVKLIASIFDLILVKRLNLIWHIPDKWAYMLGHGIIFEVTEMLNMMPAIVLTSKVCPLNMESTVYALLAGFQNYGISLSRSFGVALIDFMGIQTTKPCNFDNLGRAIVLGHGVLPLLSVPLIWLLIPDRLMTTNLIDRDDAEELGKLRADGSNAPAESV